jgi:hypothetical protein
MKKPLAACLAFGLTVGLVAAWIILTRPTHERAPSSKADVVDAAPQTWRDRVIDSKTGKSPAELADIEMNNLRDANERKALVEWTSAQPWADHKTPVLRKAMIADANEEVQVSALEKSVYLAEKRGPEAIAEVIRAGMGAGSPRVVQQSLREARKHPLPELVPDLLEVADSKAAHRFLAVDALAFTDDDRARAKVVEVASREDGDKSERIRAIALLSKVKGEPAYQLLGQLAGNLDDEVRKVALEALAARDVR